MEEAVLLTERVLERQRNLAQAGLDSRQLGAEQLHDALAREARPHPRREPRVGRRERGCVLLLAVSGIVHRRLSRNPS